MNAPITTYAEACRYLDDLQMHKIKLGLEAMRTTLAALGSPELRCPAVHVAGTNGKGSVCSMLQSVMSRAGYKTGLYTSPHLSSVRERFRIDDRFIDEQDFTRLMETIRHSLGEQRITYFECTTALAFLWFAENGCDLVILETGMGGRLDATNVIKPLLSVITAISLDHEQYLGNSLEEVAYEKAGIIKEQVPVISIVEAEQPLQVIIRTCEERQAPLTLKDRDFWMAQQPDGAWVWKSDTERLTLNQLDPRQPNRWQTDNICCALAAAVHLREAGFTISTTAMDVGVSTTKWPGRMELIETPLRYLLDGAHNQAGVDCLLESLKRYQFRRLYVIWASMADKSYEVMLNDMARVADVLLLTRPESDRAALPGDLYAQLHEAEGRDIRVCLDVTSAYEQVQDQATTDDLIVVAGSLYLIGEFRRMLVGEVAR